MSTTRWRRPVRVAIVAGLMVGGSSAAGIAGAGAGRQGGEPPSSLDDVSCGQGELVLSATAIRAAGSDGRAPSDRAAVEQFLARDYPGLARAELRRSAGDDRSARFEHVHDGRVQLSARVERLGAGWDVAELTACNSLLQQGRR